MRIEEKFTLDAAPDRVWAFLTDPVQVAGCLPGAAIIARIDDRTYEGTITVKVGPVSAVYKGRVRFERLDPERMETELAGQGQDVKGKGGAEMRMLSRLTPLAGGGTEVSVTSEVNISGILAQLGRGMIESVSAQVFHQFAAAVRQRLEGSPGAGAERASAVPDAKSLDALSLGAKAVGDAVGRTVRRLVGGGGGGSAGGGSRGA